MTGLTCWRGSMTETGNGLVLLVEDKLGTDEHSNQIARYIETESKRYPGRKIIPVYVKTGNVSRRNLPPKDECGRFLRRDLLDVLGRFPDTGDTIVDNFRAHLQVWENETISYRDEPVSKWDDKGRCYEGFYTELENRMAKEPKWKNPGWEYTNNPAGGFYCFYFAEITIALKPYEVTMYLQIEGATRLTVRLGEWSGPGIKAPFMNEMLELLESKAQLESKGPADRWHQDQKGWQISRRCERGGRRGHIRRWEQLYCPEGRGYRGHGRDDAAPRPRPGVQPGGCTLRSAGRAP